MGQIREDLPAIRRKFHEYPETLWTEFWTTAKICEYLEQLGFTLTIGGDIIQPDLRQMVPEDIEIETAYQRALNLGANPKYLEKMKGGLTGVMGIIDTRKSGPTFQYEVDIDGLPMKESSDENHVPFKEGWYSKNEGKMHSCGHDVHITMGLGVAEYVAENKDKLKGKFVFTFTPAEEGGHGAVSFSRLPLMKEIDYYFAYHDAIKPIEGLFLVPRAHLRSIQTYKIEFRAKPKNDEVALFIDLIQEREAGILKSNTDLANAFAERYKRIPIKYDNTLKAATTAYMNIQSIPKRMDGQFQVSVMEFTQGQYPKFPVTFTLTIRADNNDLTDYITEQSLKILKNAAKSFDVFVKMKKDKVWCYPAWERNDEELIALAEESWKEMHGNMIIKSPFAEMGTDDDVYMMNEIKKYGGKCFYGLLVSCNRTEELGQFGELHTDTMNIDNELMMAGVNLTIKMIEKILENEK